MLNIYLLGFSIGFLISFYTQLEGDEYKNIKGKRFPYDYKTISVVALIFSVFWPLTLCILAFDVVIFITEDIKLRKIHPKDEL